MDQTTPDNVMSQQTVSIQGSPMPQALTPPSNPMPEKDHTLRLIAFIFAILGIVPAGLTFLIIFNAIMSYILHVATDSVIGVERAQAYGSISILFIGLLLPLAWTIPLTMHTYKVYKGTSKNTTAFGVLVLIFLSLISGILLLCSKKDSSLVNQQMNNSRGTE